MQPMGFNRGFRPKPKRHNAYAAPQPLTTAPPSLVPPPDLGAGVVPPPGGNPYTTGTGQVPAAGGVGGADAGGAHGGGDRAAQVARFTARLPGFSWTPGSSWGKSVSAAVHTRNAARKAARPDHGGGQGQAPNVAGYFQGGGNPHRPIKNKMRP